MIFHRRRVVPVTVLVLVAAVVTAACDRDSSSSGKFRFDPVAKVVTSCVQPGAEAVVVTTGAPSANIVYVPVYANGFGAKDTALPQGNTDTIGEYRGTWTVPMGAPPGRGQVDIAISSSLGVKRLQVPFDVADASGVCPSPTGTTAKPPSGGGVNSTATTQPGGTTVPGSRTTTTVKGKTAATTSTTEMSLRDGGDFDTSVSVSKKCVKPGDLQTVKVRTNGQGIVTYTVAYAQRSPGAGNTGTGMADPTGRYSDTFTVDVRAKPGDAGVQVVVATKGNRRSFGSARFEVGSC